MSDAGGPSWPPALKEFANRVFAAATPSNRQAVENELREVIFHAFSNNTIHSTDWSAVQLQSLQNAAKPKKQLKKRPLHEMIVDAAAPSAASSSSQGYLSSPAKGGVPTPAAAYMAMSEEESKREKRARRFEKEQEAFHTALGPESSSSSSFEHGLAGRLGGGGGGGGFAEPYMANGWSGSPQGQQRNKKNRNNAKESAASLASLPKSFARSTSALMPLIDADVADPNVIDWDSSTIVGTSQTLEKPYLRLTSAPDPRTVRPLSTLRLTLDLLTSKWRDEADYNFICDQFKSMRQDLTVQRIKNDFTVKVYEIHARIALEKGDLGEYNQCQSQLRTLYAYNIKGSEMEFLAYRILYLLHTRNQREVNSLMTELKPAARKDPAVSHALSVRLALATGNYHSFFQLYLNAPNMNAYIMDHFIERERVNALVIMAKSFRPSVPLSLIVSEFAFTDPPECHTFLDSLSAATYIEPTPAELAAAAAASKTKKRGKQAFEMPLEARKWDAKASLPFLLTALDRYKKVDIKGQI
ncbi:unnamed protein product [Tilletia controversa]|uniref:Uncharacterized protein n=2 Tax=Tilletia TaxID=13289 RepID=A0A9N8QEM8_9BASI|nr:hypothetical protein CF335_g443 [Tilletia laevis]CAD6884573.1 unnamed protein product [Tilletia caries]CAD6907616.1 unnamed protein product [Tilletia controversa]CAD6899884.1 unnamed protein product [Tilletia caries]CAD6919194.1 unnamed protein product [Tilletia controversa]